MTILHTNNRNNTQLEIFNYIRKQTHNAAAISFKRNYTTLVRKWSNKRMILTLKLSYRD